MVAGETFSVIQEISGSDGYYWPIETGTGMYDFYGMEGTFHCIAKADAGQSFIRKAGEDWQDVKPLSYMVKQPPETTAMP